MEAIRKLNQQLGNPDIYLLDMLLKNTFSEAECILDAGCGEGRNVYFLSQQGKKIYGADQDPLAIRMIRMYLKHVPAGNFVVANLDALPFANARFDAVICSAVLHFARDHHHFRQMWEELTRVTKPGGLIFLRMASRWGIEEVSGEFTFYLDQFLLAEMLEAGWQLEEPWKSVLVEGRRSMAVLLLRRSG